MTLTFSHLGSMWYHSQPFFPNQYIFLPLLTARQLNELVNIIDSSNIYFVHFFLSDEPKAETEVVSEDKEIKVAGYLNLAADAFHNFTDGNS